MKQYTLRSVKPEEIGALYDQHMVRDFPADERPKREQMIELAKSGFIRTHILTDGEEEYAYVMAAQQGDYVLYTHIAVFAGHRGSGLGSTLLALLNDMYRDTRVQVLEVENPEATDDPKELEIRNRRIRFYQHAGFAIVPGIRYVLFGVDMWIMVRTQDGVIPPGGEVLEALRGLYYEQLPEKYWHHFDAELLGE